MPANDEGADSSAVHGAPDEGAQAVPPASRPRPPRAGDLIAVAVGGTIGTSMRAVITTAFPGQPGELPWSTLVENVSGAFLLAVVITALAGHRGMAARVRLLLGAGALGAYTSFSAVSVELHGLVLAGRPGGALLYALSSIVCGIAAAAAGVALTRRLVRRFAVRVNR